jgi:peptidoglycan/LPS O-acetylase OafA/YrhL
MSLLYPWFMLLLFLVAGVSSRYALGPVVPEQVPEPVEGREGPHYLTHKQFIKSRTLKLLVPATIGLFVFQWMTGYFNTAVARGQGVFDNVPTFVMYFIWAFSGIGPLWFIQDLWLFSILLVLFRVIGKDWLYNWITKIEGRYAEYNMPFIAVVVSAGFVLVGFGSFCVIREPRPETADGLWNLYRPVTYFVAFLLGYYLFSRESIQEMLAKGRVGYLVFAVISGVYFTVIMSDWPCVLYAWFAILAMLSCFKAWADKTSPFAKYMAKSSFGIYVVHYLVIASLGYMMKMYTTLPPWAMYLILTIAVFTLSPLIYEIIRRIPFLRWCVLGISRVV